VKACIFPSTRALHCWQRHCRELPHPGASGAPCCSTVPSLGKLLYSWEASLPERASIAVPDRIGGLLELVWLEGETSGTLHLFAYTLRRVSYSRCRVSTFVICFEVTRVLRFFRCALHFETLWSQYCVPWRRVVVETSSGVERCAVLPSTPGELRPPRICFLRIFSASSVLSWGCQCPICPWAPSPPIFRHSCVIVHFIL
jgi:hypothetical protein